MGGNKRVCKLEAAFKTMQQKRNALSVDCSGNGSRSTSAAGEMDTIRRSVHDDKRRRDGEKAACLFHLIFWGPN